MQDSRFRAGLAKTGAGTRPGACPVLSRAWGNRLPRHDPVCRDVSGPVKSAFTGGHPGRSLFRRSFRSLICLPANNRGTRLIAINSTLSREYSGS